MSTLLLRLAAPMQSWGASSRFKKLTTEREPTKSGVIGLIAAALGRERVDDLKDLCSLKFGVRIDQPGKLLRDYHTAHHPSDAKRSFISERYYLCDAVFVVGLETTDEEFLREIEAALLNPRFPLYLGRRSCPPVGQIILNITPLSLSEALETQEWQAQDWYMKKLRHKAKIDLELVMETSLETLGSYLKRDMPVSFSEKQRKYRFRSLYSDIQGVSVINSRYSNFPDTDLEQQLKKRETQHDPFLTLEVNDVSFESRD